MKKIEDIEAMVLGLPGAYKDYPFGEHVAVYFVDNRQLTVDDGEKSTEITGAEHQTSTVYSPVSNRKMFAIIDETSMPVRLSLKCDPQLAELLREKYESVLPGYHLNKKHWNTIICSGQLDDDELKDLIRHSYELVTTAAD